MIASSAVSGCADGPGVIRLTAEQLAQCKEGGGCSVYTKQDLQALALLGIQAGVESCRKEKMI